MKERIEAGKLTVRVYGLLGDRKGNILLSDEYRLGIRMTKFPGGGLEFGEGLTDCLKRECEEELGQVPGNIRHLYTTDHYQPATLLPGNYQVLNVYYTGMLEEPFGFKVSEVAFDWDEDAEGRQSFRWVNPSELAPHMLTLPIDQHLIRLLVDGKLKLT